VSTVVPMLKKFGYEVKGFSNSQEASEHFRLNPDGYDVVVTDQSMPGLSGIELAHAIRELRPQIPIILMTGFSEIVDRTSYPEYALDEYISKPFTPAEITSAIRKVMKNSEP